jgi:ribulose kinase
MAFTIGIDYGSNSVRAIVVDCSNGLELGSCVVNYPTGERGILLHSGRRSYFGGISIFPNLLRVMKELMRIKEEAVANRGLAR